MMMAEKLNINFSNMIYIGDNITKDFKGANNLGVVTIKVNRDNGVYGNIDVEKEFHPRYMINNIRCISNWVNENAAIRKMEDIDEENFICNYT